MKPLKLNNLNEFIPLARIPGSVLLESSLLEEQNGRYSVMATQPFLILESKGQNINVLTGDGEISFHGDGLTVLEELLSKHTFPNHPYGPGAFGYFSYELGYELQGLSSRPADDLHLPDLWFAFYDEVLCYDHLKNKLERHAIEKQKEIPADSLKKLSGNPIVPFPTSFTQSNTFDDYNVRFQAAMENIRAGNIYQVNLCRRFSIPYRGNPWDTYAELRSAHPTSLSAYMNTGRHFILSSSPELFLRKEGNQITTCPIKGTSLKSKDPRKEAQIQEELKASEKEQAEHIMIVDLERNDLGRICTAGSIGAKNLFRLESCGNVDHLVSTVRGELRSGIGIREVLTAAFPGGSVTGAPKRKAMEIIGSLEPVARGVYTGALGWIGFSGDFTLNLPIRTLLIQDQTAHLYLGSGVVADSKPELEYEEILNKGLPFFKLLGVSPHAPSLA